MTPQFLPGSIERQLFDRYYAATPSDSVRALTSSHWHAFGDQIRVNVDSDGRVLEMKGAGFGKLDLDNPTFAKRWAGIVTMAWYALRLPRRFARLRLIATARGLARRAGLWFNIEAFRQVCAVQLLADTLAAQQREPRNILIIGDGYGFCASLLKHLYPSARIVLVDLGKTLLFQAQTMIRVHPHGTRALADGGTASGDVDVLLCPAERLEALEHEVFDLAINTMSMQEMAMETVGRYFEFLRSHLAPGRHLFYCCNREEKRLVGGELTAFAAYPWHSGDRHLVDERCPWWTYRFSTYTAERGPRVLGLRMPFVNYFNPVWHRLSVLEAAADPAPDREPVTHQPGGRAGMEV